MQNVYNRISVKSLHTRAKDQIFYIVTCQSIFEEKCVCVCLLLIQKSTNLQFTIMVIKQNIYGLGRNVWFNDLVNLSIHLSIYLSIDLYSIYLYILTSNYISVYLSKYISICLYIYNLSNYLSLIPLFTVQCNSFQTNFYPYNMV